jgi:uncharacterized protein (DUF433 family)
VIEHAGTEDLPGTHEALRAFALFTLRRHKMVLPLILSFAPIMSVYIWTMIANKIHQAAGGLVISDPEVLAGKPVFRGTRLPVSTLFEYLADGLSLDYFLESFPSVTREQAVGVLLYGQRRIEEELAA